MTAHPQMTYRHVGAAFGLLIGVALGAGVAFAFHWNEEWLIALGAAIGVVGGAIYDLSRKAR